MAKSDESRDRILNAALQLFRERGFEKTTMREIAAAAGVAVGGAYYYFESKDAIVMAFYRHAQEDMSAELDAGLAATKSLEGRLRRLIEGKLTYFAENRGLLRALAVHVNPKAPLSPFSSETSEIREEDVRRFAKVLEGSGYVPPDLAKVLPRILWMYQMGIILFWVMDESEGQSRTKLLLDKSLKLVVGLTKFAGLPLMRPLRRRVVELVEIVAG